MKRTAEPSGVKPRTQSLPGCQLRRSGTPPFAETTYTSVLPSYSALKAIRLPSGEKTGLDSIPSSTVSRFGEEPSLFATQRSSA